MAEARESKIDRLLRWERGETPGPWEILLIPTNRCNQRCAICWQRWAEAEYGQLDYTEVSEERLLRLVDEADELGVREWTIVGGGEPMVRGDLVVEICERICARGMNGMVHSNGTRFTAPHFERFINMGWDRIGISLDGPDAETNDAIRTQGSFARATANIRQLSALRRSAGRGKPVVSLHMVLTATNYTRIETMVTLADELECAGGLYLSTLLPLNEACADFALTDRHKDGLRGCLERAAALAAQRKLPNNIQTMQPDNVHEPKDQSCSSVSSFVGNGQVTNAVCFEAWLCAAVVPDGRVGPCCMFWEKDAETLHEKSLAELWVGPYLDGVRRKLLARRDLPEYCSRCPSHIIARTAQLREVLLARRRMRWDEMGLVQRPVYLAKRFAWTLRRFGLRATIRRTREWLQLRVR